MTVKDQVYTIPVKYGIDLARLTADAKKAAGGVIKSVTADIWSVKIAVKQPLTSEQLERLIKLCQNHQPATPAYPFHRANPVEPEKLSRELKAVLGATLSLVVVEGPASGGHELTVRTTRTLNDAEYEEAERCVMQHKAV